MTNRVNARIINWGRCEKEFTLRRLIIILFFVLTAFWGCGRDEPEGRSDEMVLHNRLRMKVKTLDPMDCRDVSSHAVASELFECLYEYHYLKRPYELGPCLADGEPSISDDGLVYTIKIKKGVLFHDDKCFGDGKGRELKAGDFVFAWKRLADIKNISKNWWIFDNKIVGLDEFREYTKTCKRREDVDYSRDVAGLQAVDDYTLVVKLKRPWPIFMWWLADIATSPIAKEAVDMYGKNIRNYPVGTGPFKLKVWRHGSYVEAVRNPNYREVFYPSEGEPGDAEKGLLDDAGKQMPFLDRIMWRVVVEDQPRWLMLLDGQSDMTGIPKDNFGQAVAFGIEMTEEMKQRNIKLLTVPEPDTFWIGFNFEDPVIKGNKPLRLAVSYALDRDKYIELFHNGRGIAADGFIPPNMPGYDANIKKISNSTYDPEKAREYVKQAEEIYGGELPELRLALSGTSTTYIQMGQFYKSCLEEVGLEVRLELYDWPTYLAKLHNKSHQMFISGWLADYPDVENFLQVYYGKNKSPGPNGSNYENAAFDKIYEKVVVMPDSDERTELYRQAERIIVEDAVSAFVYHRIYFLMAQEWMGNLKLNAYKPDALGYGFSKYYKTDSAKRKEYKEKYK